MSTEPQFLDVDEVFEIHAMQSSSWTSMGSPSRSRPTVELERIFRAQVPAD